MIRLIVAAAIATGIGLVGCGKSAEDAKLEKALAHQASRKPPGLVRVVNLGPAGVSVKYKDLPVGPALGTGYVPRLTPIPSGPTELKFAGSKAGTFSLPLTVEPELGTTILLLTDGKSTVTLPACPYKPTNQGNVHVFFVLDGKRSDTATASIKGPAGTSEQLSAAQPFKNLTPGAYTFGGADLRVDPAIAYTLVFIGNNGKLKAMLMKDTNTDRPAAGSAASG